jgi:hypothetical protein
MPTMTKVTGTNWTNGSGTTILPRRRVNHLPTTTTTATLPPPKAMTRPSLPMKILTNRKKKRLPAGLVEDAVADVGGEVADDRGPMWMPRKQRKSRWQPTMPMTKTICQRFCSKRILKISSVSPGLPANRI